jgi:hemoglobin
VTRLARTRDELPMTAGASPYDAMGGEPAVRAVLQALYDRLFVDPIVGFLFDGKDKTHIVEQQVALTCRFLGGPQRYEGKPLPEAHAALPLLPGHFDRRHHLLSIVLEERGVPEEARRAWLRIDESLRSSVLAAGQDARDRTHRAPE